MVDYCCDVLLTAGFWQFIYNIGHVFESIRDYKLQS